MPYVGNPELRLALNEDLVIGKSSGVYGSVVLDDVNFHECVHLDEFESSKVLHFLPPDGEFSLLNYRVTADFRVSSFAMLLAHLELYSCACMMMFSTGSFQNLPPDRRTSALQDGNYTCGAR
ncbi:hypothetical protein EON65_49180 [archaeon]|nr:MAG: hypothetical protein EON65_49180 [archaeon]